MWKIEERLSYLYLMFLMFVFVGISLCNASELIEVIAPPKYTCMGCGVQSKLIVVTLPQQQRVLLKSEIKEVALSFRYCEDCIEKIKIDGQLAFKTDRCRKLLSVGAIQSTTNGRLTHFTIRVTAPSVLYRYMLDVALSANHEKRLAANFTAGKYGTSGSRNAVIIYRKETLPARAVAELWLDKKFKPWLLRLMRHRMLDEIEGISYGQFDKLIHILKHKKATDE